MEEADDNSCNGTKIKKKPLDLGWNRLFPNTSPGNFNDRSPEVIITTSRNKSGGGGGGDDLELMTKTDDEINEYIARQKKSYKAICEWLPDRGDKLIAVIRRHEIELERRKKVESEKETWEAEYGKRVQKRKRKRLPILQAKRPSGLLKGNSCCRSPDQNDELCVAQNNAIMNTEYQQEWPFIKQSAIWATFESLESYWQLPQKPHFSPLKEVKADYREGLAISHMVTFDNLFQKISNIQLSDPVDIVEDSLEILVNLETHGFDVDAVRARINDFLSSKVKLDQLTDMAKKDKEEFEKCKELMNQLEARIKKLKMKMEQNTIQIIDCEIAFKIRPATRL